MKDGRDLNSRSFVILLTSLIPDQIRNEFNQKLNQVNVCNPGIYVI